jgi:hypothetical protein
MEDSFTIFRDVFETAEMSCGVFTSAMQLTILNIYDNKAFNGIIKQNMFSYNFFFKESW